MRNKILNISFLILAAVSVFFISKKPAYNWDMIAYMGVSMEYSEHNQQIVHDSVYSALQHEVPANVYAGLTNNIEDRRECSTDVAAFENQLSFFRTKPLYTVCIFLLHKAKIPLVTATIIPSVISSFLILVIIFFWLSSFLKKPQAFIVALLFLLLPIFIQLECYSTPDPLSNMLILFSLYLLFTNHSKKWIVLVAALSILARIDNFIFATVLIYFLYLKDKGNAWIKLGVIGGLTALCVFAIPMMLGDSADWFTKFAFLFSFSDYIRHWRDVIYIARTNIFYMTLAAMAIFLFFKGKNKTPILYIIITTALLHLILFPSLQERFFAAYEFSLIILFIHYLSNSYKGFLNISNFQKARIN